MALFLITFFLIYSGLHLYLFARVKGAIPLGTGATICLIIFLIIMLLAPFLVRISERYGLENSARFMAYTGYIWMGLLFIFFVVSLILDLYRLFIYAGSLTFPKGFSHLNPSPLLLFIFPALVSLGINTYGYFEAKNPHTEKMTVESARIPENIGKIRIVQISDVHIGIIVREERLKKIVDAIKKADPDILVSTGDLLDGQMNNLAEPTTLLKSIQPRYGKFAITGNHEFYAGLYESIGFIKDSGFSILRDEGTTVAGLINIIGMDDPAGRRFGLGKGIVESQLLSQFPRNIFTLLLKHQPVVDVNTTGLFDLQLSGHTHKGQIFPFSLITRLYFPNHAGYFSLPRQSRLYVNRGTGTWGPPIRFLAPPEITVIDLVHKRNESLPESKERSS
jgi:predicted MPP superfamily phosphohydrolase